MVKDMENLLLYTGEDTEVLKAMVLLLLMIDADHHIDDKSTAENVMVADQLLSYIDVSINPSKDELLLVIRNNSLDELRVLDSIGFDNPSAPVIGGYRFIDLSSDEPASLDNYESIPFIDVKSAYAHSFSTEPITLKPGEDVSKAWKLSDAIALADKCVDKKCNRLLQFKISIWVKGKVQEDDKEMEFTEIRTPWVLYFN